MHPHTIQATLLGQLQLDVDGRQIPDRSWPRRSARSLLLLLLLTPGHRLPRDVALDALWPDASPESAARELRKAVHALRRVLEPELTSGRASSFVEVAGETISLCSEVAVAVDTITFERALASASTAAPDQRRARLREALALYGGDMLADEPYVEWTATTRERLRQRRHDAALLLASLDAEAGEPGCSLPTLERLLADQPDEAVLRALMRALAAAGQPDQALRRYQHTVDRLQIELGVTPEQETTELAEEIRTRLPRPRPLPGSISIPSRARVPAPPNALVGRERELEQVQDLLLDDDVRLVTLTGPGGVGKTRLAQEIGRSLAGEFAEGACFVPLAAISDADQVLPSIAHALDVAVHLGTTAEEAIAAALGDRQLLLVLDNFEQVLGAATGLAALLDVCAGLTILATSREPLWLRAEHEVAISTLAVPETVRPGKSAHYAHYEAVALFIQRARAARADFALTDQNATSIATLCQRLDGLPLAIELCAAHARRLDPQAMLDGLADRFTLLSHGYRDLPDRHRSLRQTIAWSYDLLPPSHRVLLRHLAVFAGGFTADASVALMRRLGNLPGMATPTAVHEALEGLVAQSLVQCDRGADEPRYTMLESIRAFGLEQLGAGESAPARTAHAHWLLELTEEAAPDLADSTSRIWLDRLEADLANIRAALGWALEHHETEIALRIASALRRFWLARGLLVEGRNWLTRALTLESAAASATRMHAIFAAGELSYFLDDLARAKTLAVEGLGLAQALGDDAAAADALLGLGQIARDEGNAPQSIAYLRQGLDLVRETGQEPIYTALLQALGASHMEQDDLDAAEALFREALGRAYASDDARTAAANVMSLSKLAHRRGDNRQALALIDEALAQLRDLDDAFGIAHAHLNRSRILVDLGSHDEAVTTCRLALELATEHGFAALAAIAIRRLGTLAAIAGEHDRAARRFGAADAFARARGVPAPRPADDVADDAEGRVRRALGEARFAAARRAGASLTADEAVAEALYPAHRG